MTTDPITPRVTGGYYAIHANVSRTDDQGWTHTQQLPTFYLHANVQGILSEHGARHIARQMISDILNMANDMDVSIYVDATHIGDA